MQHLLLRPVRVQPQSGETGTIYHHRGAQILADPAKAMVDTMFPVFPRIWVSTVDLGTQSSILLSGGGGR